MASNQEKLESLAALMAWCDSQVKTINDLLQSIDEAGQLRISEPSLAPMGGIFLPVSERGGRICGDAKIDPYNLSEMPELKATRYSLGAEIVNTIVAYREHLLRQIRRIAKAINEIPEIESVVS